MTCNAMDWTSIYWIKRTLELFSKTTSERTIINFRFSVNYLNEHFVEYTHDVDWDRRRKAMQLTANGIHLCMTFNSLYSILKIDFAIKMKWPNRRAYYVWLKTAKGIDWMKKINRNEPNFCKYNLAFKI